VIGLAARIHRAVYAGSVRQSEPRDERGIDERRDRGDPVAAQGGDVDGPADIGTRLLVPEVAADRLLPARAHREVPPTLAQWPRPSACMRSTC
jgi:hypothetical protein